MDPLSAKPLTFLTFQRDFWQKHWDYSPWWICLYEALVATSDVDTIGT